MHQNASEILSSEEKKSAPKKCLTLEAKHHAELSRF
jgi:hypothetical protein